LGERIVTTVCVIGARGGSQGLPGKNIMPLLGKPLIAWSIEQALETPEIDRVIVSTDSAKIAEVARAAGAQVPFLRPAELSGATVGKFQVWQHALQQYERSQSEPLDCMIDLDCTNPLRDVSDISACLAQFRSSRDRGVDAVFTVCDARKNPYFNLVEPDASGALRVSKPLAGKVLGRQSAPQVFEHVASIYVLDPAYVRRASHLLDGHTEGYLIDESKRFDVDSEVDFEIVECLMRRKLQGRR
jgi:CMP-N-acetylneuraminic acid synthetase